MQAAATLSALAVVEPASACRLLTQQLEGLQAAAEKLAEQSEPQSAPAAPAEKHSQPRWGFCIQGISPTNHS